MVRLTAVVLLVAFACDPAGGSQPGSGEGLADAGAPDSAPPGAAFGSVLGQVSLTGEPCPDGTGPLASTACQVVEVSCPSIAPARAQLRTTAAAPSAPSRGTILFSHGNGWYDASVETSSMMAELAAEGFQIVQRDWLDGGWLAGPGGPAALACRYATLLTWIDEEIRRDGALCATGDYLGAAELGFALSRWKRGEIVDLGDESWQDQCQELLSATSCDPAVDRCAYADSNRLVIDAAYAPDAPCEARDPAFSGVLLADSILSGDAVRDFGAARLHQILGADDCSPALPDALLWFDAVTSAKQQTFVPGVGHDHVAIAAAATLRRVMEEECVVR